MKCNMDFVNVNIYVTLRNGVEGSRKLIRKPLKYRILWHSRHNLTPLYTINAITKNAHFMRVVAWVS